MSVLVIPQTYTSVLFVFKVRPHIIPAVIRIFFLINWVSEGHKKFNILWLASAMVETEADQATGCCMPCQIT